MMVFSTGCKPSLPPTISSHRLRMKSDLRSGVFVVGIVRLMSMGLINCVDTGDSFTTWPPSLLTRGKYSARIGYDDVVSGQKEHVDNFRLAANDLPERASPKTGRWGS